MSQKGDKKTFSKDKSAFRPILINDVQVKLFKEDERGKHFILRNLRNSKYIKMHESIYEIVQMLNGSNTVGEIEQIIRDRNLPLTSKDLLAILAVDGFIENLEPSQETNRDPFSVKMKLFSLDEKYMEKLHRLFSYVGSQAFRIFYVVFCIPGILLFTINLSTIVPSASELLKPETPIVPFLILFPCLFILVAAHELAHALVYHHYGGKSLKVGLESHFLIPFVYTDTPDARWMTEKENVSIFLSGPLTSLFFAELFTYLFLVNTEFRSLWATTALFCHLTVMLNLTPIFRTDGYFILQASLKIPNLLEHGMTNFTQMLKLLFRKISLNEYKSHLSQYSRFERKVIMTYSLIVPIVIILWGSTSIILAFYLGMAKIFTLSAQILTGSTSSIKAYILWGLALLAAVTLTIGIVGTIAKLIKRLKIR